MLDAPRLRLSELDIAVLAGGLGTRLQNVLQGAPKVLAPIGGHPFLYHLLNWLRQQSAVKVILCLGHQAQPVLDYLSRTDFRPLEIEHVIEPDPRGTAGAVAFARDRLKGDPALIMNGDTFVDADLAAFLESHAEHGAPASILCARVEDGSRYGRVELDGDYINRFVEKDSGYTDPCWISAGVYLFNREVLDRIFEMRSGSLEHDVLEAMPPGSIHAVKSPGRFVDIGTPESLAQASEILLHA
jgi:NDP-sugar pyrophosphorylase family protein